MPKRKSRVGCCALQPITTALGDEGKSINIKFITMKKVKIEGKLSLNKKTIANLNKKTIANLNKKQMKNVKGGRTILSIFGHSCPKKECCWSEAHC